MLRAGSVGDGVLVWGLEARAYLLEGEHKVVLIGIALCALDVRQREVKHLLLVAPARLTSNNGFRRSGIGLGLSGAGSTHEA